jgi:hypothetical protein
VKLLPRSLVLLGLAAGAAISVAPVGSAALAVEPSSFRGEVLGEAWYRAGATQVPQLPPCGLPVVGCVPEPPVPVPDVPSQYPARTLHVGFAGAEEDSRTYLTISASSVPFGQDVVGGTLTLPVLTATDAGTVLPDMASLRACLVTGKFAAVEGGISGAPAEDCTTTSPAVFSPAKGSSAPYFSVDLAPFAQALSRGQLSLALVPKPVSGSAWHVAFSRSDREAADARPITLQVQTRDAQVSAPVTPDLPVDEPIVAPPPALAGGGSLPPIEPGLEPAPVPPVQVSDGVPAPSSIRPVRVAAAQIVSEMPAGVLVLPLLLVAGAIWVSRLFTRELLPIRG